MRTYNDVWVTALGLECEEDGDETTDDVQGTENPQDLGSTNLCLDDTEAEGGNNGSDFTASG